MTFTKIGYIDSTLYLDEMSLSLNIFTASVYYPFLLFLHVFLPFAHLLVVCRKGLYYHQSKGPMNGALTPQGCTPLTVTC